MNIKEIVFEWKSEAHSHARLVEQEWPLVAERCKCMQDSQVITLRFDLCVDVASDLTHCLTRFFTLSLFKPDGLQFSILTLRSCAAFMKRKTVFYWLPVPGVEIWSGVHISFALTDVAALALPCPQSHYFCCLIEVLLFFCCLFLLTHFIIN